MAKTLPLDYSALIDPVTRNDLAAFKTISRASGRPFAASTATVHSVINLIMVILAGLFVGILVLAYLGSTLTGVGSGSQNAGALFLPIVCAVLFLVVAGWGARKGIRSIVPSARSWADRFRLSFFASENSLRFSPWISKPRYPGSIFSLGTARVAYDQVIRTEGRLSAIGNFRYETGSGVRRKTHRWGYVALHLDRALPNMVLDAKSTKTLPFRFVNSQRLSLEGDFDKYFTLYCPREYERDALYVFTPDLMALLIDETHRFDVEIVDDWLFAYSSKPLDLLNPATMSHLFRIVDTVGRKTVSQTARYSDERVESRIANVVAPAGRRLKVGFPVLATIGGVLMVGYWLFVIIRPFSR